MAAKSAPAAERQVANATGASQVQKEAHLLELGFPIEKNLAGGESHKYQIALAAGQFVHVVVEQRGIDVVVAVVGPGGKQLIEVDSPNGAQGPEPLFIVAEEAGKYMLQVTSPHKADSSGTYEVRLEEC